MKELIEPSTISTDKVELIEVSNCSIRNTLKLHENEDKTKGLARFMKIKCRDCEFKHNF